MARVVNALRRGRPCPAAQPRSSGRYGDHELEKNLAEVTRLRAEFEPFALREAIRRGDDHWEGHVVASLHRLNKQERLRQTRVADWEDAHRDLHQTVIAACGMPLLLQFCSTLHDLSDRYRRLFLEHNPIDRDVAEEHERICRATLARDSDQAAYLLRAHIERTGANVQAVLAARVARGMPRPPGDGR